jgi:ubiquinone/menaquinone biosynthesis C-methylase UbiE
MVELEKAVSFLACPNDEGNLNLSNGLLTCNTCGSEFKILENDIVDLVPKTQINLDASKTPEGYLKDYTNLAKENHEEISKESYQALELDTRLQGYLLENQQEMLKIIDNNVLCDVGAGVGDHSLEFSKKSPLVFHCDLDMRIIKIAKKKAKQMDLDNILFVRSDYLSLPFKKNSLPQVVCTGAMGRWGIVHDSLLVAQISKVIKKDGKVIMDFMAKERKGIPDDEFKKNRISKKEISSLLKKFNLQISNVKGIGYMPSSIKASNNVYKIGNVFSKMALGPSRWLVTATY